MNKLFLFLPFLLLLISCEMNEDFDSEVASTRSETSIKHLSGQELMEGIFNEIDLSPVNLVLLELNLLDLHTSYGKWYNCLFELLHKNPIDKIYERPLYPISAEAIYDPFSNEIRLNNGRYITLHAIAEELIHAGQQRVYKDGISQYAKEAGASNIEFEAKLTQDIINFLKGEAFNLGECESTRDIYPLWILSICDDTHPQGPAFPSMNYVLQKFYHGWGYYEIADAFRLANDAYNFPILYDLKPMYINYVYWNK